MERFAGNAEYNIKCAGDFRIYDEVCVDGGVFTGQTLTDLISYERITGVIVGVDDKYVVVYNYHDGDRICYGRIAHRETLDNMYRKPRA